MAILFYEGLPGAGKSYEAMVTQIIPMLQKGREVVAYIEGLDHEKIAAVAELEVERVRELLHVLTREDMRAREVRRDRKTVAIDGEWIDKTRDNAFHVFDEAQNWWPVKLRTTEQLTQFVTEHRHRGIDVLLMGQSLKDVNALWRRRVDQKFTFLKLTALGSDKRYRCTVYKGQGNDEFVKVTDKIGKYDPKYFGTYATVVSDDTNTETYTDKRASVWNTWAFKYGLAVTIGLGVWGAWKSWAFFHPEPVKTANAAAGKGPAQAPGRPVAAASAPAQASPAPDLRSPQERLFASLETQGGRIRLGGLIQVRERTSGVVEWVAGDARVIERMTLDQLRILGVSVTVIGDAVRLGVGEWSALATMWPIEAVTQGQVSEYRQATIRPDANSAPTEGRAGAAGLPLPTGGLIGIDGARHGADLTKQPQAKRS